MPDDQDLEYLATQAIADFLSTEYNPSLDGILFPSVQTGEGNDNVVLFHKSSRVEPLELAEGSQLESRSGMLYEEGWEWGYVVHERVPARRAPSNAEADDDWIPEGWESALFSETARAPIASLRVDM